MSARLRVSALVDPKFPASHLRAKVCPDHCATVWAQDEAARGSNQIRSAKFLQILTKRPDAGATSVVLVAAGPTEIRVGWRASWIRLS
jgi:hypothetical protein